MSAVPVGRRFWLMTILVAAAVFAAPMRPSAAPTQRPTSTPAPSPTPVLVTIDKTGFHPQSIRVVSGQFVAWTNGDSVQHTATARDGSWDTGPIDPKKTLTLQFFAPGKWDYICGFLPMLEGSLTVVSLSAASQAPSPSPASSNLRSALATVATPTPIPTAPDGSGG